MIQTTCRCKPNITNTKLMLWQSIKIDNIFLLFLLISFRQDFDPMKKDKYIVEMLGSRWDEWDALHYTAEVVLWGKRALMLLK